MWSFFFLFPLGFHPITTLKKWNDDQAWKKGQGSEMLQNDCKVGNGEVKEQQRLQKKKQKKNSSSFGHKPQMAIQNEKKGGAINLWNVFNLREMQIETRYHFLLSKW